MYSVSDYLNAIFSLNSVAMPSAFYVALSLALPMDVTQIPPYTVYPCKMSRRYKDMKEQILPKQFFTVVIATAIVLFFF